MQGSRYSLACKKFYLRFGARQVLLASSISNPCNKHVGKVLLVKDQRRYLDQFMFATRGLHGVAMACLQIPMTSWFFVIRENANMLYRGYMEITFPYSLLRMSKMM